MLSLFQPHRGDMKVDVVLGLQYGDEGKGKVCHSLLKNGNYTHSIRFNGGGNAGHTIIHKGHKFVTHLIPSGVFFGVKSIIGAGCVVNVNKFFKELKYLEDHGINTKDLVYIAHNAHVVMDYHLEEDGKDISIGTTATGNGPAYKDKYNRTGVRAEAIDQLKPYIIDMYHEFHGINRNIRVLAEGAQAHGLDIDWGDYPYVTSSHCGVGSVLLNGFSHKHINKVYGVIKAYETYVGAKSFQPEEDVFKAIQEIGHEFGSTTGRKRQCNWLNWNLVTQACKMNSISNLIINKLDVLEEVEEWKVYHKDSCIGFPNADSFEEWLQKESAKLNTELYLSYSADDCEIK